MKNCAWRTAKGAWQSFCGTPVRALAVAAAGLFAFTASAALTAKSYITDGLIVQLDGEENVAYGQPYDRAATKWTDLTGNGSSVTLAGGAAFSSDCHGLGVQRKNCYMSIPNTTKLFAAYKAASYTFEFAYDKTVETTVNAEGYANLRCVFLMCGHNNYKFGTWADNNVGACPNGTSSANYYGKTKSVTTTVGQHTYSVTQDGLAGNLYFDDLAATAYTVSALTESPSTAHGVHFNYDYHGTSGLDGYYHSVRLYNRPLTADEIAVNRAVDKVRYFGVDAATLTLPSGWRFDTTDGVRLERVATISVEPAGAGVVLGDDGVTPQTSFWCEQNGTAQLTLTASHAEGYAFLGWRAEGLTDDQKLEPTLTADFSGPIAAIFRKTDGSDVRDFTWGGTAADRWDNPKLWHDADGLPGLPAAFDNVTIPAKAAATLTNSTPKYGTMTIAGTLATTNWETCVRAATVVVANGGKVTVKSTSSDAETNRVWIVCDDCTIAAGGKIDVNDLGFRGSPATTSGGKASLVSGPLKGTSQSVAAAHGGHGGYGTNGGIGNKTFPNVSPAGDDPAWPKLPGSGGYPDAWGAGTDGGGAVYISAARSVTVNGSILASVTKQTSRGSNGAGGSVLIECETFKGTDGVIRADGGSANCTQKAAVANSYRTALGGGGMIAIRYDPEKESADMVSGMTISAEAGLFKPSSGPVRFGDEEYRLDSGMGTVWLPDDTLLPSLFGKGLTGVLVNNTQPYAVDGDLEFSSGHVRLAAEGASLTVSGDLLVSGAQTRLEIGGLYVTNLTACANIYAGKACNTLKVGGKLTIDNGGRLDLRAAETNALEAVGAKLDVTGALLVKTNGSLHCWSDQQNFGSPVITAGSVTVDEGGLVTGFAHGAGIRCAPYSLPSGDGGSGAHGGEGGSMGYASVKPKAYDDKWLPLMPGAGGVGGGYAAGGMGGGVVHIETTGDVTVNGTIDVNGMNGNGSHPGGGGAGGTILIRCGQFAGGETAMMTAKGGDGVVHASTGGGSGAGGRIAVWTDIKNLSPKHKVRHFTRTESLPTTYLGEKSVDPGTHALVDSQPRFSGGPGTMTWTVVNKLSGLKIFVR